MFTSEFPIINVTVDIVVIRKPLHVLGGFLDFEVLAIERANDPFKNLPALPGGFLNPDESAAEAASRELAEETGVLVLPSSLKPLDARTAPLRDPRGPTISLPYYVAVPHDTEATAGDDAAAVRWLPVRGITQHTKFAFDHKGMIAEAIMLV